MANAIILVSSSRAVGSCGKSVHGEGDDDGVGVGGRRREGEMMEDSSGRAERRANEMPEATTSRAWV